MTQTVEEAVTEFHEKYGHPIGTVRIFDAAIDARVGWMLEEMKELMTARSLRDEVEMLDALCDLVYFAVGMAVVLGLPFDLAFAEVQRSNMSKLGADGKPIYGDDHKVVKGPNYDPPHLAAVIEKWREAVTDQKEIPKDTVRRLAGKLVRIEAMIDAELERVRRTDDLTCEWWQRRRRQWVDGVGTAHAVSEGKLWKIKSAFYEDVEP